MNHRKRLRDSGISNLSYWLSYFADQQIEVVDSQYNGPLEVTLRRGRLQLCTEEAVYSYDDRYDNFRLLFESIEGRHMEGKQVLLLGLGLGSVALLLDQHFPKIDRLTSVEFDPDVARLAQHYVLRHLHHITQDVVIADAARFVHGTQTQYDVILSDLFIDDEIPAAFTTEDYLYQLEDLLRPSGVVMMNTLAYTEEDRKRSIDYFQEVFKVVYPDAGCYHCWENYMLVSDQAWVGLPEVGL